jgi:hypothetical protein
MTCGPDSSSRVALICAVAFVLSSCGRTTTETCTADKSQAHVACAGLGAVFLDARTAWEYAVERGARPPIAIIALTDTAFRLAPRCTRQQAVTVDLTAPDPRKVLEAIVATASRLYTENASSTDSDCAAARARVEDTCRVVQLGLRAAEEAAWRSPSAPWIHTGVLGSSLAKLCHKDPKRLADLVDMFQGPLVQLGQDLPPEAYAPALRAISDMRAYVEEHRCPPQSRSVVRCILSQEQQDGASAAQTHVPNE